MLARNILNVVGYPLHNHVLCSSVRSPSPCPLKIATPVASYKYFMACSSFYTQVSEFSTAINTNGLVFPSMGVYIIWKWDCPISRGDILSPEKETHSSDYDSDPEDVAALAEYSLVFKCIGSTKDQRYQHALKAARDCGHYSVPVRLVHETNNPHDARALAFACQIEGIPYTIGYVVSELLEEVHTAINNNNIISVKFSWIRYITDWTKSGPGFYAGVEITKKGPWSQTATRSSSTR